MEKINFDACTSYNKCSIGSIRHSSAAVCEGTITIPIKDFDEAQTEALEALQAIIWENESNIRKLQLEGDNNNVVEALNGRKFLVKWK